MCIRKLPINVKNVIRIFHLKANIEYMCAHTLDPNSQMFHWVLWQRIQVATGPTSSYTNTSETNIWLQYM